MNAEVVDLRCAEGLPTDRPWIIKVGFDPTAPDLHLGHAVLLRQLRRWQDCGHEVILVVGDFTATIGDPTGRNAMRPVLDRETVVANARTYVEQATIILDSSRLRVVYNSEWFSSMGAAELIGLLQGFTVAQMTARNDVASRLTQGVAVGLHELTYPVLQGFDSVKLACDLEVGGQDQLFNLMAGRTMQEMFGQPPQAVAMLPLLVGLDGRRKMSKSLGNHIGLTEPPMEVFGKVMRIEDAHTAEWGRLLGIEGVESKSSPYQAKRTLARGLVTLLHGKEAAISADADWEVRFSRRDIPIDAPPRQVHPGTSIASLLVEWEWVPSLTQARQKIKEGAVRIDGEKVVDASHEPMTGVVQLGRRRAARILRQTASIARPGSR